MLRPRPVRDLLAAAPGGEERCVGAASGLARVGDTLYVIADDEHELAVFPHPEAPGTLVPFLDEPLPDDHAERKRLKPDLEALVHLPRVPGLATGALLALGSGSTERRRRGFLWRLAHDGGLLGDAAAEIDLAPLYEALDAEVPELNVEGAAIAGERLLLLQRGNGARGVNAAVELDLEPALADLADGALTARALLGVRVHELGLVDGVRLGFTDGAGLPDGRVVFSAVAEAAESTYEDGECVGAGIGVLDPARGVERFLGLDPLVKVEGVSARLDGDAIELLLVADADDPEAASPLMAARIEG